MEEKFCREILQLALDLAEQAGNYIAAAVLKSKTVLTKSGSADLVTETDQFCEDLIKSGILKRYPNHNFIGEETAHGYSQDLESYRGQTVWIVDPIDGTTNFVHGLPHCCVSIGVLMDCELRVGVVHAPLLRQTFFSIRGHGAFLRDINGTRRLAASGVTDLTRAAICLESGYDRSVAGIDLLLAQQSFLLKKHVQTLRMYGSCALNMCYVAAGFTDGYFEKGNSLMTLTLIWTMNLIALLTLLRSQALGLCGGE
jgi:myo-inositol-1(or 4)-monophosphatase